MSNQLSTPSRAEVYAVVVMPSAFATLTRILPPTPARLTRGDRIYALYVLGMGSTHALRDLNYTDPVTGQPLIEMQYFISRDEAREWVDQRVALRSAKGTVQ